MREFDQKFRFWIRLLLGSFLAFVMASRAAGQTNSNYSWTNFVGQPGVSGSADGTGSVARFAYPYGVAIDSAGNLYVADQWNNRICKVTGVGVVTTLAGAANSGSADGTGTAARFSYPSGVAVDSVGNVYVADSNNNTIRKVTPAGVVTTLAGSAGNPGISDGVGNVARFNHPNGVGVDNAGNVYVADTENFAIRKVTAAGAVTTLAGSPGNPGLVDGTGYAARFLKPSSLAVDNAGNLYVAELGEAIRSSHRIRKVTATGVVTTLAGSPDWGGIADGTGSAARFAYPEGVAVDGAGNVYVADSNNNTIRKVTPAGVVTTIGGSPLTPGSVGGTGSAARFNGPYGVTVDTAGNLYVADQWNNRISKATPSGSLSSGNIMVQANPSAGGTVAGAGSYVVGSSQQISAMANSGWIFTGWTDGNTNTPRTVIVPSSGATFTANFTTAPVFGSVEIGGSVVVIDDLPVLHPLTPVSFSTATTGTVTSCGWEFGDGTTTSDCEPSHVFSNCGPHEVTAIVSDGFAPVTNSLLVSVACPFSELPKPTSLKMKSNFAPGKLDTATFKSSVDMPAGFSASNTPVTLELAGSEIPFTLNAKGQAKSALSSIKFSHKGAGTLWQVSAKLKGDFDVAWQNAGLANTTVTATNITVPVLLLFDISSPESFYVEKPLLYKATAGKSGSAK